MTDQEWNQQDRTTAGAINSHNEATEDARRAAANAYARSINLIDEQEDLINQYRGQGINKMQAVQSYVDANKKDWEEAQKAIDAIAKDEGFWTTRRGVLGALAAALGGGAAGSYFAGFGGQGGGSGSGNSPDFQSGESYSMGPPDNFDSLIEGDSEFYDWIDTVDYEINDLGAETYLTETDGVGATVRELERIDEDNDLAVLGEEVLGELEPDDLNQRRIE